MGRVSDAVVGVVANDRSVGSSVLVLRSSMPAPQLQVTTPCKGAAEGTPTRANNTLNRTAAGTPTRAKKRVLKEHQQGPKSRSTLP